MRDDRHTSTLLPKKSVAAIVTLGIV